MVYLLYQKRKWVYVMKLKRFYDMLESYEDEAAKSNHYFRQFSKKNVYVKGIEDGVLHNVKKEKGLDPEMSVLYDNVDKVVDCGYVLFSGVEDKNDMKGFLDSLYVTLLGVRAGAVRFKPLRDIKGDPVGMSGFSVNVLSNTGHYTLNIKTVHQLRRINGGRRYWSKFGNTGIVCFPYDGRVGDFDGIYYYVDTQYDGEISPVILKYIENTLVDSIALMNYRYVVQKSMKVEEPFAL